MLRNIGLGVLAIALLDACSYGHKTLAFSESQIASMEADSQRVQNAERAERAERRAERREEMMDAADAINRANQGRNVYILH